MIPTSFDESNTTLSRPSDMTDDECSPLSIVRVTTDDGFPLVVSCWKFTQQEFEEIQRTGRVWLGIVGHTMPPVILTGIKTEVIGVK